MHLQLPISQLYRKQAPDARSERPSHAVVLLSKALRPTYTVSLLSKDGKILAGLTGLVKIFIRGIYTHTRKYGMTADSNGCIPGAVYTIAVCAVFQMICELLQEGDSVPIDIDVSCLLELRKGYPPIRNLRAQGSELSARLIEPTTHFE